MDTTITQIDKRKYSLAFPGAETVQQLELDRVPHKSWAKSPYVYCLVSPETYRFFESETNQLLGSIDVKTQALELTELGQTLELGYRPVLLPLTKVGYFDQSLEDRTDVSFAQGGALYQGEDAVHAKALPVPYQQGLRVGSTRDCGSVLLWTVHNGFLVSNYIIFTGTLQEIIGFVCKEVAA